jgi:glycosyltransferase involved in cell wall biosynthesis
MDFTSGNKIQDNSLGKIFYGDQENIAQEKLVYIIIPVHNRRNLTLTCLENLKQTKSLYRYSVVIVDDGSTDGTSTAIHKLYPDLTILAGNGDLWWTGAIAQGMQYAYDQGAEFIIWLNDDCELAPETLKSLVQFCQDHPKAIVGAQGFAKNDPETLAFGGKRKTWQGYRYLQVSQSQIIPCDLLSGNIVCLPRSVIDAIGYPDIKLTPHYGGDSLYLLRAQKTGFQLYADARHPAWSLPGDSKLYPTQWLSCEGEPSRLIKLVFNPNSGLSWRVWLHFNWEAYSIWGLVMFSKKYTSILLITLLRYWRRLVLQH